MGGEDGPADVAVGGHGRQFPPRENNQRVTLTHLTDIYWAADRKQHLDTLMTSLGADHYWSLTYLCV